MSRVPAATGRHLNTYDVLGCKIHALTAATLTDVVEEAVGLNETCIVANHNLHSLCLCQKDPKLRSMFSVAKWIHADGMGIILLGRVMGVPLQRDNRITYVDWTPLLMKRAAARKWRVFYVGSKPGVAEKGAAILRRKYPGLQMKTCSGYFDVTGNEHINILEDIRTYGPHILMVGMGMPRQEHWIMDNISGFGSAVVLPCGATIDYVAGAIPTPPRWAGRCGLEWLYRLLAEPRRLSRRYLIEPWVIVLLLFRTILYRQDTLRGNTNEQA